MPELSAPAGEIVPRGPGDEHRTQIQAEIRAAREAGQRWRRISRWLGLGIFVFGSTLLAWVFVQAYRGFGKYSNTDYFTSELNRVSGDDWQAKLLGFVAVFGRELFVVLYLLILGFLASAIAARGIQFFAASEAVIDEAVIPGEDA